MNDMEARCPKCRTLSCTPVGFKAFHCYDCNMDFEPGDDGDIGNGRPDRIAESREEFALRQRDRKAGRR